MSCNITSSSKSKATSMIELRNLHPSEDAAISSRKISRKDAQPDPLAFTPVRVNHVIIIIIKVVMIITGSCNTDIFIMAK